MEDGRAWSGEPEALEDACLEFRLLLRHVECSLLPPGTTPCGPHLPDLLRAGYAQLAVFEGEAGKLRRGERCWAAHHLSLLVILRRDTEYLRRVLGQFYREREGAVAPN